MATRFRAPLRRAAAVLAIGAAGSIPLDVHATTVDELEAAIAALRKQVDELRAQSRSAVDTPNAPAANVVTGGKAPGSFKLPGSDTSITLGGYVKLDAVYSNPSAGVDSASDLMLNPSSIPVGPTAAITSMRRSSSARARHGFSSRRIRRRRSATSTRTSKSTSMAATATRALAIRAVRGCATRMRRSAISLAARHGRIS